MEVEDARALLLDRVNAAARAAGGGAGARCRTAAAAGSVATAAGACERRRWLQLWIASRGFTGGAQLHSPSLASLLRREEHRLRPLPSPQSPLLLQTLVMENRSLVFVAARSPIATSISPSPARQGLQYPQISTSEKRRSSSPCG